MEMAETFLTRSLRACSHTPAPGSKPTATVTGAEAGLDGTEAAVVIKSTVSGAGVRSAGVCNAGVGGVVGANLRFF